MKKFVPFLTAALLLSSCSLIPNANGNKASSAPTPATSQPASQPASSAPEELEIDEGEAAEATLMQATIGMGMIAEAPIAPAGRIKREASPLDSLKQTFAEMIAAQVANFRVTCGVNNAGFTHGESDREGYANVFTATVGLGGDVTADAKLYYTMFPDLTYTGGLKMAINGLALVEDNPYGIPEFPIEGYFITAFKDGAMQNAFWLKASMDERNFVECNSDFAPGAFTSLREIGVKVTVSNQLVFDETIAIMIPDQGDIIVYVTYTTDTFTVKIGVSSPEEDSYRIECEASYYGIKANLNANAVLTRDEAGKPVTVTVHYDDDAEGTVYSIPV
ncbi:MAG: hypothetical protein J6038_05440 [Bacilli bacterium]|nr:hypothetical protein [Bacilli bacterium]